MPDGSSRERRRMTIAKGSASHEQARSAFATSPFWSTTLQEGRLQREPTLQVHAKTMGTAKTLCGQSTLSWAKFWDVSFATVRTDRCPRCIEALITRTDVGRKD
ncbi:hypothetical protein [Nocardioides gansuensis]|uniref:hypothetical protein n=1 Tax=Nocardioides gansuensis TaxID=2138300 RepID=UPI001057AE42|nr:hypothetical protein [Nocardioides gansuensis]